MNQQLSRLAIIRLLIGMELALFVLMFAALVGDLFALHGVVGDAKQSLMDAVDSLPTVEVTLAFVSLAALVASFGGLWFDKRWARWTFTACSLLLIGWNGDPIVMHPADAFLDGLMTLCVGALLCAVWTLPATSTVATDSLAKETPAKTAEQ